VTCTPAAGNLRHAVAPRTRHFDAAAAGAGARAVVVFAQPSQLVGVRTETSAPANAVTEQATERDAEFGTERRVKHEVYRTVDDDQQVEQVAGDFQQMQLLQQSANLAYMRLQLNFCQS